MAERLSKAPRSALHGFARPPSKRSSSATAHGFWPTRHSAKPRAEEERDFVNQLLKQHGAEKVAAAFVRLYHAGRSAPEDIFEVALDNSRAAP